MKKTLIALAVGSAFAAPAAYADVTLSGSINAGPAVVKTGDGSTNAVNSLNSTGAVAAAGATQSGINTNYSNITIGSLEDLGGGLKLDFAYQLQANFQSSQNVAQNRNSHIGLVGDSWGGIWYGTNEMLYESYYYTVDPLDGAAGIGGNLQMLGTPGYGRVFDNPGADPSACGGAAAVKVAGITTSPPPAAAGIASSSGVAGSGCAGFYRRDSNALWYNSPNFNGFSGGVYATLPMSAVSSGASVSGGATSGGAINPWLWGIGAKYVGPSMPLQAWAAYEQHHDMFGFGAISGNSFATTGALAGQFHGGGWISSGGSADSSKDYGVQLGVGYTFGDIFAFVNFEQLKYQDDIDPVFGGNTATYKRNAWSIGAKWNVATGYVGGQFINALNASCDGNIAAISNASGTSCGDTSAWMIGLGYYHTLSKQTQAYIMGSYTHNAALNLYSTAGGITPGGPLGATVTALTVGLKHSF
ncbi:MAG TPA: porin [Burkholderiales bacterium]|nr:porin [Burkholderiales bacterium]